MKKIFEALITACMALSLAACSNPVDQIISPTQGSSTVNQSSTESSNTESSNTESSEESSKESSIQESSEDESSSSDQSGTSLEEYILTDDIRSLVKQIQKSGEGVLDFDIKAEDDHTVVYEYTYVDQLSDSKVQSAKKTIDETLKASESTYISSVEYFEQETGVDGIILIMRYINADGTNVYECSFDKSGYISGSNNESSSSVPTGTSLEEYVLTDDIRSIVEQIQKSGEGILDFDIKAEDDNTVVYEYTYVDQLSDSKVQSAKKTFDEKLKASESTYISSVEYIEQETGIDGIVIILRYINADGTFIYECSFDKSGYISSSEQ